MNHFLTDPKVLWFVTGLALLAAEFAIPGLTVFFFGVGALITAACLSVLPLDFSLQVCLFLASSMAGLFLFRSKAKSMLAGERFRFRNAPNPLQPEVVGFEVDVIEDISPPRLGRVLLHGASWRASSSVAVKKGDRVRIRSRDGLVVVVEAVV